MRARVKVLRELDEDTSAVFGADWSSNDDSTVEAQAFIDSQERGRNSISVKVRAGSASAFETFSVDVTGISVGKRVLSESGLSELVLVERLSVVSGSERT